jgi:NAD+ kinase
MIRNVGIVSKPRREEIAEVIPPLVKWLHDRGLEVFLDEDTAARCIASAHSLPRSALARRADLLVVLGGDGTILAAARALQNREIPILPVNLGGLGFLTSVTLDEMYPLLEAVLAGNYQTSERMMLEAEVVRDGHAVEKQQALNDAVVSQVALARMMDFTVNVDATEMGSYSADGLIVATPTGSTAYSLAAGGPIVQPDLDAFVITPICPHMLTNRPLVVPGIAVIDIGFPEETALHLTLDGQVGFDLRSADRVVIRKSANRVKLVRAPGKSYYDILRSKLRWAER